MASGRQAQRLGGYGNFVGGCGASGRADSTIVPTIASRRLDRWQRPHVTDDPLAFDDEMVDGDHESVAAKFSLHVHASDGKLP